MSRAFHPWQLLVTILAGWMNEQQQQLQLIEYLRTENQVLKETHGKKRIALNDDQRRRLAVKGKVLGRKLLGEIGTLVTPDTILRWHRMLVAEKWNHTDKRKAAGRPPIAQEVVDLVLKFAKENLTWGYDRIADALANLGHEVSDQTVGNILKSHGVEPVPTRKRQTNWSTFLKAHWDQLAAIDFTTMEIWATGGLTTFHLLFTMQLAMRRVHFAGCTTNPDGPWMRQIARNLTDIVDGPWRERVKHVLMDRDTKFTDEFRAILTVSGITPVRLPPKSPNCNAHLERFFQIVERRGPGKNGLLQRTSATQYDQAVSCPFSYREKPSRPRSQDHRTRR